LIPAPDVTIIVAVCAECGGEVLPKLQRALASIGGDPAVEILVVEDGADPHVGTWLGAQAAADPRMLVLRGPRGGVAAARNIGIAAARAPLVAFLDPGDVWQRAKLGAQRALHAGHPDLGFSFTDATIGAPAGTGEGSALAGGPRFRLRHRARRTAFLLGRDALAQLFAENVVATSTVVARTDLLRDLGGFAPALADAAEWDLWLRLAGRAPVACRPAVTVAAAAARPADAALAMAAIAMRHAATARRQNRAAARAFAARRFGVRADAAATAGAPLRAVALRLAELACQPGRRAVRRGAMVLPGAEGSHAQAA